LPLTKKSKEKHRHLEEKVLLNSDKVLVVGETMKENYKHIVTGINVITNGYDTDSVSELNDTALDNRFSITHIGLMNADRNPKTLWKVLLKLIDEEPSFKNDLEIKLVGSIADEVENELKLFSPDNVVKINYVSHKKVTEFQRSAQVLLLAVNNVASAKGIITGKIFEYLQARRPILAIGPVDGDLASIIKETNSGSIIGFDDVVKLKQEVLNLYREYKNGALEVKSKNIDQYHRKELTRKLADIIKEL
jgi:hypothetical protein